MRFFKYVIAFSVGLSGCGSFNVYDPASTKNGPSAHHETPRHFWPSAQDDEAAKALSDADAPPPPIVVTHDEAGRVLCPLGHFTALPPPPPLPIDQLRQLSPQDKDALIRLLTDHIDQLRQYSLRVRDLNERQRHNYAYECRKWLIAHGQ